MVSVCTRVFAMPVLGKRTKSPEQKKSETFGKKGGREGRREGYVPHWTKQT